MKSAEFLKSANSLSGIVVNFLPMLFFCFAIFFVANTQTSFAQATPATTDSRIRTLVYNSNEVYELKFYYGYQSFIEFAEDEEIEMISIGEAFAWRLTPAGKRLFVRPLEIAGHTNMTIISNKRTYHFDIRSGEYDGKADEELIYTVRFFYPQLGQPLPIPPVLTIRNPAPSPTPQLTQPLLSPPPPALMIRNPVPQLNQPTSLEKTMIKTPFPSATIAEPLPNLIGRNPENSEINLDFSLAGKSDNIMPLKVYDDGKNTYFQFPNDNLIIPTINLVDIRGNEQSLTYVIRDNFVEIPVVGRQFTLRLSDSLLCVYNNKLLGVKR